MTRQGLSAAYSPAASAPAPDSIHPIPRNGAAHPRANGAPLDLRGHLDLLNSLNPHCREIVLTQCGRKSYRKGQVIWRQGDPADSLAFLLSGKAMSTYHSPNGKTGVTGFWGPGDMLGCADIAGFCTRQMTVRCLEATTISTLPTARLFETVRKHPEVGEAVIRALSVRLRWVSHLALTLETAAAFERVCSVLLALSERFSVQSEEGTLIDLSLTHEDLAAIVGVSRQFMNITLHDLQRRKLIRLGPRRIVLLDPKKLEALV